MLRLCWLCFCKPILAILLQLYAPQTKILEGRTIISECVFEALLKGVSTGLGIRNFGAAVGN